MVVSNLNSVEAIPVSMEGVKDVFKQVLIGPGQGWDDHVMRVFTLKKSGYTPLHTHPWFHVSIVLEGEGMLILEGKEYLLKGGSFAFVPAGSEHQFKNAGEKDFRFVCIVPAIGEK